MCPRNSSLENVLENFVIFNFFCPFTKNCTKHQGQKTQLGRAGSALAELLRMHGRTKQECWMMVVAVQASALPHGLPDALGGKSDQRIGKRHETRMSAKPANSNIKQRH